MTLPLNVADQPSVACAAREHMDPITAARLAVGLDDQRVRVDGHDGVQREQVARILQYPPPAGVVKPDQLQVRRCRRYGPVQSWACSQAEYAGRCARHS